jgi:hypothetical protein
MPLGSDAVHDGKTVLTRSGDNTVNALHMDGTSITIAIRVRSRQGSHPKPWINAAGTLASVSNMGRGGGDLRGRRNRPGSAEQGSGAFFCRCDAGRVGYAASASAIRTSRALAFSRTNPVADRKARPDGRVCRRGQRPTTRGAAVPAAHSQD